MEYYPFVIYRRIPFGIQTVAGPITAYFSIIFNTIVLTTLFDKSIMSPATVLMQGLAISDILTAVFTYGMEPLFYIIYETIASKHFNDRQAFRNQFTDDVLQLITLRYPYCYLHYIVGNLAEIFHLISSLLTSLLGMQKLFAIIFPFWTRAKNKVKTSVIICFSCGIIVFVVNIPRLFVVSFSADQNGTCMTSIPNSYIEAYVLTFHPILVTLILCMCVICMLSSTIIIIVTLCKRKLFLKQSSISERDQRACNLVMCVMIVFLVTEVPRIYLNTKLFTTFSSDIGKKDIIWNRINKNVEKQLNTFECIRNSLNSWSWHYYRDNKTETNLYFTFDPCDVPENHFPTEWKEDISRFAKSGNDVMLTMAGKVVNEIYVRHVINRFSIEVNNFINTSLDYIINVSYCSYWMYQNYTQLFHVHQLGMTTSCLMTRKPVHICAGISSLTACTFYIFSDIFRNLEYFVLGSACYSEFMNFALNIFGDQNEVSMGTFKLYIEVLKLCTVLGCASNFLIYLLMSKMFRHVIFRKITKKLN